MLNITRKTRQKSAGFTLIELLVVVAIIGILAAIVLMSLQSARRAARDTRRVADVKEIITALHVYYNNYGGFPDGDNLTLDGQHLCTGGGAPGWVAGACDVDQDRLVAVEAAPMPPDNPLGSTVCDATNNPYVYTMSNSGESFALSFCLGGVVGDLTGGVCSADENSMHCP